VTEVESGAVVVDRIWQELNSTGQREVVSRQAVVEILKAGARTWVAVAGDRVREEQVAVHCAVRTWVHRDVVTEVLRVGAADVVAWLDEFVRTVESP
jgi:hypothetical protein